MTQHKHLKQLVRARMQKTGESYTTARRHVTQTALSDSASGPHLPGNIPAATALRIALTRAGVNFGQSKQPMSEAMTFGIAGGIGVGLFSFVYEKENFASFHLAGRHLWHDYEVYLTRAAQRCGAEVVVRESSGIKPALASLRALLDEFGVCVAWVDAVHLPHRGHVVGPMDEGGAYHVVTVYGIDDAAGTATIGDLADDPITIPLDALGVARSRIKKDKNRVLAVRAPKKTASLADVVGDGLRACYDGLAGDGAPKAARKNFSLESLSGWAEKLGTPDAKESWTRVFTPGPRLWRGLTSIYDCIEYSLGTGGGLSRPVFADYLAEAGAATKQKALTELAARYRALGDQWTALADAALPPAVPMFAEVRGLYERRAELSTSAEPASVAEKREVNQRLTALASKAAERFPLSSSDSVALLASLGERVAALHAGEMSAREAIGRLVR
jgi:hypothetical protein